MPDLAGLTYPRLVYRPCAYGAWHDAAAGVFIKVESAEACARALTEGWFLLPVVLPPQTEGSTPAPSAPVPDPPKRSRRK